MITLSVANQKGGTGKTTTRRELGAFLAAGGLHLLLVDLDQQGSLTAACGLGDQPGHTLTEVLGGAQPRRLTIGEVVQDLGGGMALSLILNQNWERGENHHRRRKHKSRTL